MKSIKILIVSLTVILTVVIFTMQTGYSLFRFSNILQSNTEDLLKETGQQESRSLYEDLLVAGMGASYLATDIAALPDVPAEKYLEVAKANIKKSDMIVGSGFWFEPYYYDPAQKYYGPYVYPDGDNMVVTWDYSNADYDYFKYDWYKDGMAATTPLVWSEPYLDTVSGITMISVTSPIDRGDKRIGTATVDLGLSQMTDYVKKIKVGKAGYAFIVTKEGYYAAVQDEKKNMQVKITDEKDKELSALGSKIVNSAEKGIGQAVLDGKKYYVSYAPIGDTGMNLVLVLPTMEALSMIKSVLLENAIAFILAMVIFILLLSLLITKQISNPIKLIVQEAEKVSACNLTCNGGLSMTNIPQNKTEIGLLARAFLAMEKNTGDLIINIREMSGKVSETSKQTTLAAEESAKASEQVAVTMGEVAKGATEQATAAQVGSDMLGDIMKRLENVTSELKSSERLTETAKMAVTSGADKVGLQKIKMEENKAASEKAKESVNTLSEKSKQIGEIVNVIGGIAEQTNLLALNAAIEAARAGEQGRGFAVVADEVRKLAEQSASSSQEISALIKEIQDGVAKTVSEMDKAVTVVGEEEKAVEQTFEAFSMITSSVDDVMEKIRKVAQEAVALSGNAVSVSDKIDTIASITEENAAGAEEVAATTEELTSGAEEMASSASRLTGMIGQLMAQIEKFKI